MFRFPKMAAAGLTLTAGMLLAGCASTNGGGDPSSGAALSATFDTNTPPTDDPVQISSDVTRSKDQVAYERVPYTVPGYEGPRVVGFFTRKVSD
jgi:hypothetical protein